jgi:hypothetical protein
VVCISLDPAAEAEQGAPLFTRDAHMVLTKETPFGCEDSHNEPFRIDAQPGVRPVSRMAPAPELGPVGWSTVCETGASQGYGVVYGSSSRISPRTLHA